MNIQQLRRIIRQESPSRLADGIVVSVDPRGTRTASVRVSGGHVHSRVYTCDDTLEIGDQVVIARLEGLARQVVIGKIVSQHGSSLSKQGVLAPPNNFTALSFAGVTYCQWGTYPGEDISWEVQYSLNGSPYADATKVLVSRGSYYFYPCDPGTTVYFRARGIRWLGDNNLMYSAWSGWANVTCADFEAARLLVELTNKAGKQVEEGWVVVLDTGNANSFKTTVTADDEDVIGVAFETIANDATGLVCISGLIDVYVSDAPAIGDYLISSVTEGNATGSANSSKGCFGRALTTKAGNTVSAIIDPPIAGAGGVLGHNLLSVEHPDTLADAVARGDILVGNATPKFARLVAKTDKQVLVGDGTDIVSVPVSLDVTLANTGAATVVGIRARTVGGAAPVDGQVYTWDAGANEWAPTDQAAAAADLGIGGNPTFKADGVPIVISGVDGAYVCPGAGEIAAAYLHCATTGTISDVPNTVIDVNINGTTIFTNQTNRPMLAWNDADHVAKSGVPNTPTLAELDVLTVDIDQVATGASGLSVVISLAGGGGIIMIEIQEDDVKVADVTVVNFEGEGGRVTDEGGGKATVALGLWELIEEQELTGTAATVTFNAIPQDYRMLVLMVEARTDRASHIDNIEIRFNGDAVLANYVYIALQGNDNAASSAFVVANNNIAAAEAAQSRANTFGYGKVTIPRYAKTNREKRALATVNTMGDCVTASEPYLLARAVQWLNTAAITSIVLVPGVGPNFVANSIFTLYGVL